MSETIISKTEGVGNDALADVNKELGATTNEVAHHTEDIAEHTQKLESIEGDAEWTKNRIASLEAMITQPSADVARLEAEIASLRSTLDSQTEKLSELLRESTETTSENETLPPPPTPNKAAEKDIKGPLAGLRKQLHRLL